MGLANDIAVRIEELHGSVYEDLGRNVLVVTYETTIHHKETKIPLSGTMYERAIEWLETTHKELYNEEAEYSAEFDTYMEYNMGKDD